MRNDLCQLLFAAGALAVGLPLTAHAEDAKSWLVETKKIKCVVENLDAYQKVPTDIVIIYLDACPEADPTLAIGKIAQNAAIPKIPKAAKKPGEPEKVIFFSKAQIGCLSRLSTSGDAANIVIPRDPCRSK